MHSGTRRGIAAERARRGGGRSSQALAALADRMGAFRDVPPTPRPLIAAATASSRQAMHRNPPPREMRPPHPGAISKARAPRRLFFPANALPCPGGPQSRRAVNVCDPRQEVRDAAMTQEGVKAGPAGSQIWNRAASRQACTACFPPPLPGPRASLAPYIQIAYCAVGQGIASDTELYNSRALLWWRSSISWPCPYRASSLRERSSL